MIYGSTSASHTHKIHAPLEHISTVVFITYIWLGNFECQI